MTKHFFVIIGAALSTAVLLLLTGCSPAQPSASAPTSLPGPPSSPPPAAASPSAAVAAPSPAAAASPSAAAGGVTIQMTDALRFEPASVTVPRGATVTWRNTSQTMHTVTDDPSKAANKADAMLPSGAQPWDSGTVDPGRDFTHTFDTPGTYKYFCQPHEAAGMVGTIIVSP